ncbi:MAG TPA: endonuclease/exonuclease/phosphatase family protein [Rariglobus sp.]
MTGLPSQARHPRWSLRGVADAALHVAMIGATGVCLLTLAAFAGGQHGALEITTHFRPHYAIILLACSLVWFAVRRPRFASVLATFALINIAVIAPRFAPRPTPSANDPRVKLLLCNVHTANRNHLALLDLIDREQPDVIALLEVNARWLDALAPLAARYPHAVRAARSDNFGIALFSRLPLDDARTVFLGPSEVPSIRASILLGGRPVRLLATHPIPPGTAERVLLRDQQLAEIARWCVDSPAPALVLGDLNCTPWSPAFRRLLREGLLADTGTGLHPTWPVSPWWLRIPLDHCLVSRPLRIADHRVGPDIGSDHFPLVVSLSMPAAAP